MLVIVFFLRRVQSRIIRILQLLKDWGVHFVYYARYASLFAMKLEKIRVNDKTTAWCQTNTSPKHYIKRCKQVTNTRNILWKTVRLKSFQKPQCHRFESASVRLACVASVSVRFRSKERGTRVKDRAKNGASKRAKPKIPFLVLFLFLFLFLSPRINENACYAGYCTFVHPCILLTQLL